MDSIVLIVDQNAESLAMQRLIQASRHHRQRANGNSTRGGYCDATFRSVEKARIWAPEEASDTERLTQVVAWRCNTCKRLHAGIRQKADACCRCRECKVPLTNSSNLLCDNCQADWSAKARQRRIDSARDATETRDWGPSLYCDENGKYYQNPEDVLDDFCDEEIPEWLWGSAVSVAEVSSADTLVECMLENIDDEVQVDPDAINELQSAIDAFNAKCKVEMITPNYGVKVRVPKNGGSNV